MTSQPRRAINWAHRIVECVRRDWRLAWQMTALRISMPVLKRLFNVNTLARLLWSPPREPLPLERRRARLELITSFVETGGRLFVSRNCLDRSLMLFAVLSRADANPTLILGARKGEAGVAGHAWIELDELPVFDHETSAYTPVVTVDFRHASSESAQLRGLV